MDEVLVVTGAGRGIGAAVARQGAAGGWRVAIHYGHSAGPAEALAAEIRAAGGAAEAFQAEIADAAAVARLFAAVDARLGRLGGLVNNAGIIGGRFPVMAPEPGAFERVLAVNVAGAYHATAEAARRMARSRGGAGGAIVNVSSMASRTGSPGELVHYAAAKAALETFNYGLASEVATEGIRVNAVACGLIETGIHAEAGDASRLQRYATRMPMQRAGRPEEVAEAIVWLLSDAASYVTGAVLPVAGGR